MTYDTERAPRIPTESPEAAQQSEQPAAAPDRPSVTRTDTASGATRSGRTPSGAAAAGTAASGDRPSGSAATAPGPGPTPRTAPAAHRTLIPEGDQEKLSLRLQHAVTEFVESPLRAVGEAESTFDSAVDGLASALKEHRRELNAQQQGEGAETRTEELRITLQHYRDLTERLLNV